jgi:hypothetical protein
METQAPYEVATKDYGVVNFEEYAMSSEGVIRQVNVIQSVMKGVMKIDEHYGTIPGTSKPSLYKPGAEKLSLVFRLRPEYDVRRSDLPGGHREYEVICTLYHIPTGQSVGQGVGSATTMEGKYRYRGGEKEGTGQPIPKEYWNMKKAGDSAGAQALIGGPGFAPGKIDGQWEICSIGEKQEHDNPADYYNTILKMAKKRAHVDAILTATAASDIFTQDVEDMPEVIPGAAEKQPAEQKPPVTPPQKKSEKAPPKDTQSIVTPIANVESKDGVNQKTNKPYTIYGITDAKGAIYKTFDKKIEEVASKAWSEGKLVKISFTVGQYGNDITGIEEVAAE